MNAAETIAILCAGAFFLIGLITGVWKFREMAQSREGRAHRYVDIAHRSALLYSFAALLLAKLAEVSQLPERIETAAVLVLVAYFAAAILIYSVQGLRKLTENQFVGLSGVGVWFMWSLVVAEIGGFTILLYGAIVALLA